MKYPRVQVIISHLEMLEGTEQNPNIKCGFDMNFEANTRDASKHPCGSACCIGGHATILLSGWNTLNYQWHDTSSAMADLCGIPCDDAEKICWPMRTYNFPYSYVTLDDALRVLRHYRDTGEVDWRFVQDRYLTGDDE